MTREMKDSGVEWIGKIPSTWITSRIGSEFKVRNQKVSDKDYMPLSVTKLTEGIVPQMDQVAKSDAHDDRKLVLKGDFVINSRSDRKMSCGVSNYDGSVSLINIVLEPVGQILSNYTHYLLKNYAFAEEFYKWGHGIVADLWTTNSSDLKRITVSFPNIEEQQKIVETLNKEISQIDKLIANQEKQIELLNSNLNNKIDKIINDNCSAKKKLKNIVSINGRIGFRGYTQKDLVESGEGAITISPSNMDNLSMNYSQCSYLAWNKYYESPEIMLKNGDVLFVKTGSSYGKSSLVDNLPMEATINPQLLVFKDIKINSKYLIYALQTREIMNQIKCAVVGGTIPTISQDKIGRFIIKLSENEDKVIADIQLLKDKYDKLIKIKKNKINLLNDYKKSIIYEYVTGKKAVD